MGGARATVVLVTRSREASHVVTQRQLTQVDSIEEEGKSCASAAVSVSAPPTFTSPFSTLRSNAADRSLSCFDMASQSQGIQQLLQAEKRAAEKVAEARKREYDGAALCIQQPPACPSATVEFPQILVWCWLCVAKNKEGFACKIATIVVKRPNSERICSSALCSSWRHHMRRNTHENVCCLTSTFATVAQLEGKLYW